MANLLLKRIKDWSTSITSFRTGDVIPVDGPNGTAKMSKDDLLKEAADNTLSSIKSIDSCATEDDLKAGNYLAIDGAEGTMRLPAEAVAKAGDLEDTNNSVYKAGDGIATSYTSGIWVNSSGLVENKTNYKMFFCTSTTKKKVFIKFTAQWEIGVFIFSQQPSVGVSATKKIFYKDFGSATEKKELIVGLNAGEYVVFTCYATINPSFKNVITAFDSVELLKSETETSFTDVQKSISEVAISTIVDTGSLSLSYTNNIWITSSGSVTSKENYKVLYDKCKKSGKYKVLVIAKWEIGVFIFSQQPSVGATAKSTLMYKDFGATEERIQLLVDLEENDYICITCYATQVCAVHSTQGVSSYVTENAKPRLPLYYTEYMAQKISSVTDKLRTINNGFSFVFVTDSHWFSNELKSKLVCRDILDKTNVPFVVHGGDFVRAYGTEHNVIEDMTETENFIREVGIDRCFVSRGNHDFTIRTSASVTSGYTPPSSYTYNAITRHCEKYQPSVQAGKMYFYVDVPASKTRLFVLNSCDGQTDDTSVGFGVQHFVSQEQKDWLSAHTKDVDGWHFIFVSHIAISPLMNSYDSSQDFFREVAEAVNNKTGDYANTNNKVVACINGHSHLDENKTQNGVLYISTTSDAYYVDGGYTRNRGTTNEQALDVFCFDYDSSSLDSIRFGAGNDRSFSF